ncbi:unnamed protein product [Pleuronectes platessa]|uniref:Uncharacterized protein n=1 Tax=Pleuronectes platessa TaxID=8262 RepID=A0A9N7U660_PLEPL|nr:unnamed protein product [Pleuronectes platessa]
MRALRATGSGYHSQVQYADKLTMTAELSRGVCVGHSDLECFLLLCTGLTPERLRLCSAYVKGIPQEMSENGFSVMWADASRNGGGVKDIETVGEVIRLPRSTDGSRGTEGEEEQSGLCAASSPLRPPLGAERTIL